MCLFENFENLNFVTSDQEPIQIFSVLRSSRGLQNSSGFDVQKFDPRNVMSRKDFIFSVFNVLSVFLK